MSDTDDTDALLLIPPNYFSSNADQELQRERKEQYKWQDKENESQVKFTECVQYINNRLDTMLHDRKNYTSASDEMKLVQNINNSNNNNNNNSNKQQENIPRSCNVLSQHNLSLHNSYMAVHNDANNGSATLNRPFINPPASELSAICLSDSDHNNHNKLSDAVLCSTPKTPTPPGSSLLTLGSLLTSTTSSTVLPMPGQQMLNDIKKFLITRDQPHNKSPQKSKTPFDGHFSSTDYQDVCNKNYDQQKPKHHNPFETNHNKSSNAEPRSLHLPVSTDEPSLQMLNLGDMWRNDMPAASTIAQTNHSIVLKEEQLRRQHLEKTVHGLQVRLLEYQQRFSVAVEVDRSKNEALSAALINNKSLQADLEKLGNTHQKLVIEHAECGSKLNDMQKELTQAVNLAAKFEQKNDKLQQELDENYKKHKSQVNHLKKQLEELEVKYQVTKKTEENALNDLSKLKDKLVRIEHQHDKYKTQCDDLEKENQILRNQKISLQEFHHKQKLRADALEERGKSLQEAISKLNTSEASLEKKIELQQKHLKAQYQKQVDNVVTQKHKEFQDILDKTEETLRKEAREREALMAERAVKQLQAMHEKNEQEFVLLEQKHNEEIALYRIQLANSNERIEKLEEYLNCYKSRRTEIAEQLHDVMETQWQKALEILISPARSRENSCTVDSTERQSPRNASPGTQNDPNSKSTKLQFCTESTNNEKNGFIEIKHDACCSRQNQKHQEEQQNNALRQREQQSQANNDEIVKRNRLQAYIDLLLSKSPMDVAKLDELLNSTDNKNQSGHSTNGKKFTKCTKTKCLSKPPWKS